MGTGYERNDTSNNIADGNVINASDLDGEFDAIQAAFNGTTGHSHDGTTGEGPQIAAGGLASNAVTTAKILDANVTLAKMAANSVDSDQYVDGSIDTVHIANDAVTGDKLANNIQIAGTLGVTGETTLTTHLNMGDNDIIKLGAGADLQIYHDGTRSFIQDVSAGNLILDTFNGNEVNITSGGNAEFMIRAIKDGAVNLYYDNSPKLATTATGIDVTGNVVVSGNVDGRDVASDGSKLDGIESGATADQSASEILTLIKTVDGAGSGLDADTLDGVSSASFLRSDAADTKTSGNLSFSDNVKAQFGSGNDLEIFHDGADGRIHNEVTGRLIIRNNVTDQDILLQTDNGGGSLVTYVQCDGSNGQVQLNYYGSTKLNTKTDGVDITGELQADSLDIDGNADISGQLTMGGNVNLQDNDILQLGSSQDLKIYHNGTNSFIDDTGTGDLYIRASDDLYIQKYTGEIMLHCNVDSSVDIYYDNAVKFQTKSDGVDIIGELQSDSLDVDGAANISGTLTMGGNIDMQDNDQLRIGTSDDLQIYHNGTDSYIDNVSPNHLYIRNSKDDHDVFIQSDDGSGGLATYFLADGSTGRAILYNYGSNKLQTESDGIYVTGNVQSSTGHFEGSSANDRIEIEASSIDFYIDNSIRFRMETDGDFHADADVIAYSTTVSDERLKTDIEKIENATDKVSQLNGYTFTYKADGKKSAGVIAQEVEKVLPSAVREKELPLKMDDGVAYKTVQYDQIIGLLIESIKELKQEINELKGA